MKNKKTAILFGITGQDGSHLSDLLIEKGFEVHGVIRRSSSFNTGRIDHLMNHPDFNLHYGDITDALSTTKIISEIKPDYIFNLAAQSHVKVSFEIPNYTAQVDAVGTLNVLEAVRHSSPNTKIYQASTSELFGKVQETPQKETTPFYPRSPYGVAKMYGYWIVKNYREAYNLFACNGILFNHSGERRGKTFILRKITTNLIEVKHGKRDVLKLGNLNAKRDIGYAKEYVEGMLKMLEHSEPDDFVLATGKMYSIREFVEIAGRCLGYDIEWKGEGVNEKGYDKSSGKLLVEVDPKYFRPSEVDLLIGDASKAKKILGWEAKTSIEELIKIMIDNDLKDFNKNQ